MDCHVARPGHHSTNKSSHRNRPVTVKTLPPGLVHAWLSPDGRACVQVLPKGELSDTNALRKFATAILAAEPSATGPAISYYQSGETVTRAFIEAGILALVSIALTMAWRAGKTGLLQSTLTRAVIFSAMTNAIAFGSMAVSSYPGMASMGKLMALALFCTLAAAVLFQPVLMGRPRQQDSGLRRRDPLPAPAE